MLAAYRHWIDAELRRLEVDHAFDEMRRLRPPGAAVCVGGGLMGEAVLQLCRERIHREAWGDPDRVGTRWLVSACNRRPSHG